MSKKHALLGVTGSIAAYKAADIIRRLQDKNFDVAVVMTESAQRFITPLTLATLSGNPVYSRMFDLSQNEWDDNHIALAQWADVFVVAPASAHTIAKMALGLADDLLSCTALAVRCPVIVAPAMNENMYTHPAVVRNCAALKERGLVFVDPAEGTLACGTEGKGHLASVEDIVASADKAVH